MKYIEYPLYEDGYVNRFLTTGIDTKKQRFTKAVLSGNVNEWLKYGFSIHENPCRKEFIDTRKKELPPYIDLSLNKLGDSVSIFAGDNKLHMYVPFGNIGVEESGFYYTPTYLRSYSYTILKAEKEEIVEFELETCGGLTLWINDQLVTDYTPFTRNMVKRTRVSVGLKKGENKCIICLDDLAERDTDYYFRMKKIGDSKLSILLPVDETVSIDTLMRTEFMLEQISFEKEAYISESVPLQIRNSCGMPMKIEVTFSPGEFIEKMYEPWKLMQKKDYILEEDQNQIELLHSDQLPPGYYNFIVSTTQDGINLKRKIGSQLVKKEFLESGEIGLAQRKQRALELIAKDHVNNVYKAAALFKTNQNYEAAEDIIFEELEGVRLRQDCSDFHFIIILYIYRTFYTLLSEGLRKEIEETMKNYRYWMDEPGDDVMWFFSENHALLFHICQYLAGAYLPDAVFINSGLKGHELHKKAIRLLDQWFENFFEEFITEWNSSAYIPIDVLGLGTLYNLTEENSEMHQKAKKALDMVFYCLCINEHKGVVMTSYGRTYEKELKGTYNAGTTGLLYIAYNAGYLTRSSVGYLPLILGDYEAPEEYGAYLQLSGTQMLIHQNTQGFEKHVNLYLYKNADVLLSTAIGYKPAQQGYQEHIVQAAIDGMAQVFINHPGESHPYGSGRPNFWAGNGILPMAMQYRDLSILKYDIEEHRIDYTHAYIPLSEFKQYIGEENVIVLEKAGGYIGVKAMNGLTMQESGPCRHREFISSGRLNVWVVKVAQKCQYGGLSEFLKECQDIETQMNDAKEVTVIEGSGKTYFMDQKNQCFVKNGEENQRIYNYPLSVKGVLECKGD